MYRCIKSVDFVSFYKSLYLILKLLRNAYIYIYITSEKVANARTYGMSDRKQVLTILCKQTKMINKRLICYHNDIKKKDVKM